MNVSRQHTESMPTKGPRARTWRLMVETAGQMMQEGKSPSVSEVAEAAEVSRSTAYRYFPTVDIMVQAVVGKTLGPILDWDSDEADPAARVKSLIRSSFPGIAENETTHRAALRISLDPNREAVTIEQGGVRGHRVELLERALSTLPDDNENKAKLIQALSMMFGVEALVVLRDICGLDAASAEDVVAWAAQQLVSSISDEHGMANND
jgi:AcrR family transcriptional regulator